MKPQTQFLIAVGLIILILGITWYTFPGRNQKPTQVFPATIYKDCAPWDGAAFIVYITLNNGAILHISIWQAPDIKLPVKFTFPDETGQIGFAYILPYVDPLQQQRGEVSFWRVKEGSPVEGEFNFRTESGEQYKGKFKAEWGNEVVYCG
jgi:hypothetical protein